MESTRKNESDNKIRHKGQHVPTKNNADKIYTQKEHKENRKMRRTDVGYEILECQSIF